MEEIKIRPVEVADVLAARDARAARQTELLAEWKLPLVSFCMNIAGPVKRDVRIEAAFCEGMRRIEDQLRWHGVEVKAKAESIAFTGCECIWAVDGDAQKIKIWMRAIEEADALGRLFDIDVIAPDGAKLSRETPRRCLICGETVAACARSRAHSADELFHRAQQIIVDWQERSSLEAIGACAERALHFEALVTPKPGLVDRVDSGAHRDMDIFSFAASAVELRSYFEACARIGLESISAETLERLRFLGRGAEEAMLRATGGVNTHKGAIFSLGILCCAAAGAANADELFRRAAEIAKPSLVDFAVLKAENASTGGERQYLQQGLTGARGEAAAGFPSVRKVALPEMRGASPNDAGLRALTALMAHVQDSNILRRRGGEALRKLQAAAQNALSGANLCETLRQMNRDCIRENISPGGSADLLAAAFFVTFWEESKPCLRN